MSQQRLRRRRRSGSTTSSDCWPDPPTDLVGRRRGRARPAARRDRDVPGRARAGRAATSPAPSRHADLALALAAAGDDLTVGAALGAARAWPPGPAGTSRPPHRGYPPPSPGCERAGNISDVLGCSIALADIRHHPGPARRRAQRTFEDAPRARRRHEARTAARDRRHARRAEPDRAASATTSSGRREPPAAQRRAGRAPGLPQNPYRWRVATARLREAEGDLDGALDAARGGRARATSATSPRTCGRSPRARARVLVAAGDSPRRATGPASRTSRPTTSCRTSASTSTSPWPGSCCPARRADGPAYGAERCSIGCCAAAEAGGRDGTLIEILVLLALAHHAHGDTLRRARPWTRLRLAEPEGYVRVFVDEGPPMAALLEALVERRPDWRYPRTAARRGRPSTGPGRRGRARRPAQRARARGAPAARQRPRRARHRPRAVGLAEHRADPHQEHLRQARRQQPPRGGHAGPTSSACCTRR